MKNGRKTEELKRTNHYGGSPLLTTSKLIQQNSSLSDLPPVYYRNSLEIMGLLAIHNVTVPVSTCGAGIKSWIHQTSRRKVMKGVRIKKSSHCRMCPVCHLSQHQVPKSRIFERNSPRVNLL